MQFGSITVIAKTGAPDEAENGIFVTGITDEGHERTTKLTTLRAQALVAEHIALILAVTDADALVAQVAETLGVSVHTDSSGLVGNAE